jgi:hypothetical protein
MHSVLTLKLGVTITTIWAEGTSNIKCAIHLLPKITCETIPLDRASRRSHRRCRWGHDVGHGMTRRGRERRRRRKTWERNDAGEGISMGMVPAAESRWERRRQYSKSLMEQWRKRKSSEGNDVSGRTGSGGCHSGTEAEGVRLDHFARKTLGFKISECSPNSKVRRNLNVARHGARVVRGAWAHPYRRGFNPRPMPKPRKRLPKKAGS